MAGRLDGLQPDAAELHAIAVAQRREHVLGLRGRAQMDRRAGSVAQFEMTGDEIRMQMREEDVRDPQAARLRERQVLIDVALRIDDRSDPRLLVGDQIRRVRQAVQIELMEDHAFG